MAARLRPVAAPSSPFPASLAALELESGVARKDGTPACHIDKHKGFSKASVQGWGFIGPHGAKPPPTEGGVGAPHDVTRMVAALMKCAQRI